MKINVIAKAMFSCIEDAETHVFFYHVTKTPIIAMIVVRDNMHEYFISNTFDATVRMGKNVLF